MRYPLYSLIRYEVLNYTRKVSTWLVLAACFFLAALMFNKLLKDYVYFMQLAPGEQPAISGVTLEVIRPFWGWMMFFMALLAPLGPLMAISLEKAKGSLNFWIIHRFKPNHYFLGKWLAWSFLITLVLALLAVIPLSLWALTTPDLGLMLSGWFTVWLVSLFILTLSFLINLWLPSPALALGVTYGAFLFIAFLPWLTPFAWLKPFTHELSFLTHSYGLMHGRLYISDGIYFGFSIVGLLTLSLLRTRRIFTQLQ